MQEKIKSLIPGYAVIPLLAAVAVNMTVYVGSSMFRNHLTFSSLETSLDAKIPFVSAFVLFYVLAFAQWILNYILIARENKAFCYRFVIADIFSKIICLFFFLLMPTTLTRPDITGGGLFDLLVRFIYQSDPPVNLFPSIHCLESWCCIHAAFCIKKIPKWYRPVTVIMSLGVFASTLLIKQHVIVDMFGGIAAFEIGYLISSLLHSRYEKKRTH